MLDRGLTTCRYRVSIPAGLFCTILCIMSPACASTLRNPLWPKETCVMPDDQTLLVRYARSRDAEAFAQLVHRYSTMVYAVACRVTGNRMVAEDVTQDCFLT